MQIIQKRLDEIYPYERNARKNDDAVPFVANSIKEFGFKVPIVIDSNGEIIAGHTRHKAAKKLKMESVPCIIADDLTDEQVKAFRLADNKVAEKAEWDFDLLDDEINMLEDFDFEDFGFEFDSEEEETTQEQKQNERVRTTDAYNLAEYNEQLTEGYYQMPIIEPTDYIPEDLIGFNYMLTSDNYDSGVHFYVDDYQFERVWNQPLLYLEKISDFSCMLTPDFSLYTEMPIAMKIWNTYRSRLIGQMAQQMGIVVIPTVSWCEKETFDFCFDGLPKQSTLSISTIGVKREDYNFNLWKAGVDEMIARLEPKTLLIYGGEIEYDYGNIETIYFTNKVTERMKGI